MPAPKVSLKWTGYIPHEPHPRQAIFLSLACREAFYGGAAGGGKSDALLMAALQYVDQPGYSAILFRRTYADLSLPGALMDRAKAWLGGTDAHWNDTTKTWRFPSGATLTFAYLEHLDDRLRYQGAEFQFVGFDELTQFPEVAYRYLFSRLRRLEDVKIPLRMRAASNPGGPGHEWVRMRFIDTARGDDCVFIPARLDDNPSLDRSEYEDSLNELDPITRAQLLKGDWEVRPAGNMFRRENIEVVDPQDLPSILREVRYWDLAATRPKQGKKAPDYTAGVKQGITADNVVYALDVRRAQYDPPGVERLVLRTAAEDGERCRIAMEQEGGSSGKIAAMDWGRKLLGYTFESDPVTGDKASRARPLASASANGLYKIVRATWNGPYLDELESFPEAEIPDDQVDASSGAFGKIAKPARGAPLFGWEHKR